MSLRGDLIAVGVAGVVLLAAGWYAKKKVGAAADAVVQGAVKALPYVNPADPRNLVYSGVSAVGSTISGDSSWTLGGWFYDITHPSVAGNKAPPTMGELPYDFGIIDPNGGW